jgi:hypothetical protein
MKTCPNIITSRFLAEIPSERLMFATDKSVAGTMVFLTEKVTVQLNTKNSKCHIYSQEAGKSI